MDKETFIEIRLSDVNEDDKDVLIALLSDAGFDGFDETNSVLKAYVADDRFDEMRLKELANQYSLQCEIEKLPSRNWNAVWESNFEPVVIDDFVGIRADFHAPFSFVEHEIVITPKMSFGTGHHATTTMMIQQMCNLTFSDKRVLDFGTGTGILAILAEKLGAATVLAIDNDEWSIENSKENSDRNNCYRIQIELRTDANTKGAYDIILANINRNVILENLSFLASQLKPGGALLLSGLLAEDEELIRSQAQDSGLSYNNTWHRLQWISLLFGS